MTPTMNLWLIRAYALIIAAVVLTGMLEGAAYTAVATIAAALILVQSFLLPAGGGRPQQQQPTQQQF